jgi:hypothetical protein
MEIRLHGFAEEADGRGRVLESVEPVVADDRVEINVVLRDVDLAGDGAGFLDVLGATTGSPSGRRKVPRLLTPTMWEPVTARNTLPISTSLASSALASASLRQARACE